MSTHDDDGNSLPDVPARLTPLRAKGKYSVVHLPNHWFILATSGELGEAPIARTLMGTPLVLFRDRNGAAGALLDRCPHRNVPLSGGRVAADGNVECPYHGWRFDRGGVCRAIPSYTGTPEGKARSCTAYPVIEQQGFVGVLNDLHKGRNSGRAWAWLIDLSGVLLALVSATGLWLLWYVRRRRATGLWTGVAGVLAMLAAWWLWVR